MASQLFRCRLRLDALAALLLSLLCLGLSACRPEPPESSLSRALGSQNTEGFLKATQRRSFLFPQDHGQHPGYKNEWWYFTGNLEAEDGRHFGYQLTFFRVALSPQAPPRKSHWATSHVWMAHAAVTDTAGQQHVYEERFAREGAGLAGATTDPLSVWLENWRLQADNVAFPWQLQVEAGDFSFSLAVTPAKPVVLQGDGGLSQKSAEPGNASYYYSMTRLETSGLVTLQGNEYPVTGLSWLDREWGTSLLNEDQQGWDWFSLQFTSGEELMYYRLRDREGNPHPNSLGSWVAPDATVTAIRPEDIELSPLSWWRAPNGVKYPVSWRIQLKPLQREWIVNAVLRDQLMAVSIPYWEGAVVVLDSTGGKELGRGYLEMTGN